MTTMAPEDQARETHITPEIADALDEHLARVRAACQRDSTQRHYDAETVSLRRLYAAIDAAIDTAESRILARLPAREGHGDPCYYCQEPCDSLAGNPSRWPIPLCHADDPGVVKWHHVGCVSERLHILARLAEPTEEMVEDMRNAISIERLHGKGTSAQARAAWGAGIARAKEG